MLFECPKIVNYGRRKKGTTHLDEMESVVARSEVIERRKRIARLHAIVW